MDISSPVILAFATHDPAGRCGLQAIAETIAGLGGHCASVVTGLCASGHVNEYELMPVDSRLVIQQARSILEDMPVAAIDVSYAGSVGNLEAIHSIFVDYPQIPVVCSAALQYCDNSATVAAEYPRALAELILPLSTLLVCNNDHTAALTQNAPLAEDLIHRLFVSNCQHLLSYQCNQSSRSFEYILYSEETVLETFNWQAGCCQPQDAAIEDMLAAGIATYLGHGSGIVTASTEGIKFASQAAASAQRIGFESPIPNRFFWAKRDKN